MTRWDSDNLNAAHTQRELSEIEVCNKPVDGMTYDICEAAVPMRDYRALQDRIEQLERELAVAGSVNYDLRQQLQDQTILRENIDEELAAEKALADALWRIVKGIALMDEACDTCDAYRKARGL